MYDFLKNPQYTTIPSAIQKRVVDAIQLEGKSLSCHVTAINGALITVQFDLNDIYTLPQITVPLFGPEYIRYPIKVGDLGFCQAVDVSVSYTSGQGGGPPNLSDPASLEALYFMPMGNENWVAVDPRQVTVYAPNGVLIRDTTSAAQINLHPGDIKITLGDSTWEMTASGVTVTTDTYTVNAPMIILNGNLTQGTESGGYPATLQGPITVIHDVVAGGKSLITHIHGGVQTGSGDTGEPV